MLNSEEPFLKLLLAVLTEPYRWLGFNQHANNLLFHLSMSWAGSSVMSGRVT
jgi:hypothetical protein